MAAVEVNEARILATAQGASWWFEFRHRFEAIGRISIITCSIGGDLVSVKCDDVEHATWLVQTAQEHGVPKTALKIKRK